MDFNVPNHFIDLGSVKTENIDFEEESDKLRNILDFAQKYYSTFKNYPYLFNISGYDAYLPFRMIIRELSFFKKYFGSFSYSRGVGMDAENQRNETLAQIMKKSNL